MEWNHKLQRERPGIIQGYKKKKEEEKEAEFLLPFREPEMAGAEEIRFRPLKDVTINTLNQVDFGLCGKILNYAADRPAT
ncbi:unnamed protein product [Victoria cruziana]